MSVESEIAVRSVWAQVPSPGCKGLCTGACGPIGMGDAEAAILDQKGIGVDFDPETLVCNQLKFGRCQIYDDRPLVCRLYGAIPDPHMRCPYGCEPTLSAARGRALMLSMLAIEP